MQNDDSYKLLRECSAGLKTAIASIEELSPYVKDAKLGEILKTAARSTESSPTRWTVCSRRPIRSPRSRTR